MKGYIILNFDCNNSYSNIKQQTNYICSRLELKEKKMILNLKKSNPNNETTKISHK